MLNRFLLPPAFLLSTVAAQAPARAKPARSNSEQTAEAVQKRREAEFAKLMTGCKMVGFFTMSNRPEQKPQEESYSIAKATKLRGNRWRFDATVKYGKREFTLPFAVQVEWAGDTPMIQVTDLAVPLVGTYTARVLIYRKHYAGMWEGKGHGGHMYGTIVPAGGDKPEQQPAKNNNAGKQAANWPSFRGSHANGIAEGYSTPVTWNVETKQNIRWRTPIPGLSHSSPIVWGNRLYVTTAVKEGKADLKVGLYGNITSVPDEGRHEFRLLCLDKNTGEVLWSKTAWKGTPKVKRHPKGSHAACTPATDGKHVAAFFGSEGLYVYDMDGNLKWKKNFGVLDAGYYRVPDAQWGFASSPVIFENKVLVQCDVQGQSFLACLDVDTGDAIWRTDRDEVPTWCTPTVHVSDKRRQVIVNGYKHIGGYDLDTGKELWKTSGGGDIPVPTPVVKDDLVYITNAHGRLAPILAISVNAKGEFGLSAEDSDSMVWSHRRRGSYLITPLVYGNELYCCNSSGVLSCIDAKTGKLVYRERLGSGGTGFTSSGVAADGKLYFTSEEGEVYVLRAGREFEVLAVNELGETHLSSPAVSAGTVYFRTRGHIVAVSRAH